MDSHGSRSPMSRSRERRSANDGVQAVSMMPSAVAIASVPETRARDLTGMR